MTPAAAILLGADYLVVGRPVTQANHREAAETNIAEFAIALLS
jgi:orotidine-5'-phosphate decarboxylase